jgi:CBS domain-containing protein
VNKKGTSRGVPRRIRISNLMRIIREPPERAIPKPRPEGLRHLRSDASPNWSQRISRKISEVELIASKPPITIAPASSILEATEVIADKKVRGLIVADNKGYLQGLLTATDLVNYLGGGEYYNIVLNKYGGNIYKALERETVSSIMNRAPVYVTVEENLIDVLNKIVLSGFGILPLLNHEGKVIGVITEHDIVKGLYEKKVGKYVKDYTTNVVVTVDKREPLKVAGVLMTKHRFRRLPVTDRDLLEGTISAKDYVSYFGSHEAFKRSSSGLLEEALSLPVSEVMERKVMTINEGADIGDAATLMLNNNLNYLIVVNDRDEAVGIITERDVLVALAVE